MKSWPVALSLLSGVTISFALPVDPTSPSPLEPPANTASWQSVFLGLVPLALNAMTQPSVFDLTFPQSSLLFPARSSPFVCVVDALDIILHILLHLWEGSTTRDAVVRVRWDRARSRLGGDIEKIEPSASEQHPKTFAILQVGTILQAIKIWGLKGLLWSKIWAAMYISAFLVSWSLDFISPKDWRDTPRSKCGHQLAIETVRFRLILLGVITHATLFGWVLLVLFQLEPSLDLDHSFNRFFIGITFPPIVLLVVVCQCYLIYLMYRVVYLLFLVLFGRVGVHRPSKAGESNMWYAYFAISVYLLSMGEIWTLSFLSEKSSDTLFTWVTTFSLGLMLCFFALVFILLAWGLTTWVIFERGKRVFAAVAREPTNPSHTLLVFLAASNFLFAFLYYRFRYDELGTEKPPWTENLG